MAGTNDVAARMDDKGRVTLPKDMREALGVGAGDTVFFRYDPQNNQLRIAPAKSPFDVLAERALRDHEEGRTKTVEECVEGRAAHRAKTLKDL